MVRSASMHEMQFGAGLLAIARAGAGVNSIPIDRCSEQGIAVFNTPGANANAVKELVICAALLASRKVVDAIDWCKTLKGEGSNVGKLVEKGKSSFAGPEIKGKTMGVVGMGAIGKLVAEAARDLGMRVVCFDRKGRSVISGVETVDDMETVFSAADYLTLHIPCNDSTRNIINAESIGKMKDGVRILNFARGELVNSDDILASLADLCASTPESEDNCAVMAADELIGYIERGEVKNSVNLPELALPAEFEKRVCIIYKDSDGVRENIVAALGGNITSLNSAVKNGLGYLVCDTPNPDGEKLTAVGGVVRVRVI